MTRRLHIMQASGRFNTPDNVYREALEEVYDRGADVLHHTEADAGQVAIIRRVAKDAGYGHVIDRQGGSVLVLSRDFRRVVGSFADVVPPLDAPAQAGGHGPRGVLTADAEWHGESVSVSAFHGLSGSGFDHSRRAKTLRMVDELGDVVSRNARGRAMAFWTSDTNIDEDDPLAGPYLAELRRHGLVSCWEEWGKEKPTAHKRTIDVVGSARRDARVRLAGAPKVWPPVPGLDHRQVSAFYAID